MPRTDRELLLAKLTLGLVAGQDDRHLRVICELTGPRGAVTIALQRRGASSWAGSTTRWC